MFSKLEFSSRALIPAIIFGIWTAYSAQALLPVKPVWVFGFGLLVAVLSYVGLKLLFHLARKMYLAATHTLDNIPVDILMGGGAGLFAGILVGVLSTFPLSLFDGIGNFLTLGVFCLCGFLGITIGVRRAPDFMGRWSNPAAAEVNDSLLISPKVLDTSAIIDGRIYDVGLSNFLEGQLIVPTFVIEELQHIADSSDNIRRNKGRRGLELLSKMQKHIAIKIDIIEANIPEEKDVDSKLLRLCKQINASIITNDFNLNKVAELQGIKVLNINELTNAVKVIVYPGETMHTTIIKEGKEAGQGVGYLEDGTMVVVEDAHHEIGNDLEVMVTSVFQTAAGRMIFTRKVREENSGSVNHVFQEVQEVKLYG